MLPSLGMSTPTLQPPPLASLGRPPGSWHPSPAALAAAFAATVTYEDGPPWAGQANCGGGILPGSRAIGRFIQHNFPQVHDVGGYSCRQNTANAAKTSMHGSGRAVDLMIAPVGGRADHVRGNPIADLLLLHADWIGVQCVIWDRTIWSPDHRPARVGPYGRPNPHIDHLHVEFTRAAAEMRTRFFAAGLTLPAARAASVAKRSGALLGLLAALAAAAAGGAVLLALDDGAES